MFFNIKRHKNFSLSLLSWHIFGLIYYHIWWVFPYIKFYITSLFFFLGFRDYSEITFCFPNLMITTFFKQNLIFTCFFPEHRATVLHPDPSYRSWNHVVEFPPMVGDWKLLKAKAIK